MKKFLFMACLLSGLVSYGAAQGEAKDSVIFHESFNIRENENDQLPTTDDDVQNDPNFYKNVKSRWLMTGYDNNRSTFEGEPWGTDATGATVQFWVEGGVVYTAGNLRNWLNVDVVDDWLIMKNPVKVKGDFHVSFYAKNSGGYLPVEVWYGTTEKPNYTVSNSTPEEIMAGDNAWKCLGIVYVQDAYDQTWKQKFSPVGNVSGADSVPLYFAVRINVAQNVDKNAWFRFDEFSVISGGVVGGNPDLELSEIILPEGGCELNVAPIKVKLTNNSDFAVQGIGCTVELYRDDNLVATVKDTLSDTGLASGETKEITFNDSIHFDENGSYEVMTTVYLLESDKYNAEQQADLSNNTMSSFVDKHDGLELPLEFAFYGKPSIGTGGYEGEEAASFWNYDKDAWYWHGDGFWATKAESPMKSTCINLKKDVLYSFKWKYLVGSKYVFGGAIYEETYACYVGPSGSEFDPSSPEWKELKKATEYIPQEEYKERNFTFEVDEDGSYQFVIYVFKNDRSGESTYSFRFNLDYIYISEAGSDYGIDEFYFPQMAFNTPRYMMEGEHSTVATVTNYGVGENKAKVYVYLTEKADQNLLGSSDEFSLKEGETKDVEFSINIPEEKLGGFSEVEKNNFIATVKFVDTDDTYNGNDDDSYSMKVTDSVLSFFTKDVPEYYTYFNSKGGLGIMFELKEMDTLTQIIVGINAKGAGSGSNANYDVVVRAITGEGENQKFNLGSTYFRQRYQRGDAEKIFYHDIDPIILAPGKYVVGVIQPTNTDYLFINIDNVQGVEAKGIAFSADETFIQTQQGAGGNYIGNPYIKAVFGHNAQNVSAKDVAVTEILRPVNEGVFSANEPVVAKVDNVGAESVSGLMVYCKVDDQVYEKEVETLAIGQSVEVEFSVNLAEVGEHNLSVYVSLDGDLNKLNDSVSMVVNSQAIADPTKLDFEQCADFSQTNFNPQWKSVDGDGQRVYALDVEYTGTFDPGDPVGVFVLNTFTSTGTFVNGVSTHSGDKMGVAIAPSTSQAFGEDWLISPALELRENAQLSLWSMQTGSGNSVTPSEIELYVSEVSDNVDDLSKNFVISYTNAGIDEWQQTTFDLSEYAGKTVFLGIKIMQGATSIVTMVDDIEITNAVVSNECDQVGTLEANIYPNPATDQVNITAVEEISSVEIFSVAGQVVYQDRQVGSKEYRINVEKMLPGVYFIRLNSTNGSTTAKLIVR